MSLSDVDYDAVLKRVEKSRRRLRTLLSKSVKELNEELIKDEISLNKISSMKTCVEDAVQKITIADDEVGQAMIDADKPDSEIDADVTSAYEYIQRAIEAINKAETKLANIKTRDVSPCESARGSKNSCCSRREEKWFKFPKITLPMFSGELREWIGWWSLFKTIHEDIDLQPEEKFAMLIKYVVPHSKAGQIVSKYPPSAENYQKAIDHLKSAFGREDIQQQYYVRQLLNMALNNASKGHEKRPLGEMFLDLTGQINALENLGVNLDQSSLFLFPMVESALPEETHIRWTSYMQLTQPDGGSKLENLMTFLKNEVDAEERRALARTGFGASVSYSQKDKNFKQRREENLPTAAALTGLVPPCIFCDKNHASQKCYSLKKMTLSEKREALIKKKRCFNCLTPGHRSLRCTKDVTCENCGCRHNTIFCNENKENQHVNITIATNIKHNKTIYYNNRRTQLMTLVVRVGNAFPNELKRVLLDSGSEKSYISLTAAADVGAKKVGEEYFRNTLFGGGLTEFETHPVFTVRIRGKQTKMMDNEYTLVGQSKICGTVSSIPVGPWLDELKKMGIELSDVDNLTEVDILIGSDLWGSIVTGTTVSLSSGLTAIETIFGWTLCGPIPTSDVASHHTISHSLWTGECTIADLWNLEAIGIHDPAEHRTKAEKEEAVKEHFLKSVTRGHDNRYCVKLPWIDERKIINCNRTIAEKRLLSATSKLLKTKMFNAYTEVFESWIKEGIIEEITGKDDGKGHYLPHRPVIKMESKTTPIRPVFDASCKGYRSPSLNDCLEVGPNLLELSPSLLTRFREKKVGVIADIRKAFLMISVDEEDRNYLKFLWWRNYPIDYRIFRHCRVVFGISSSPFLLGAVIEYHLKTINDSRVPTAAKLLKSLYVDNVVTSLESLSDLDQFKNEAISIFNEAKMELRQWESSLRQPGELEEATTSVLGLIWDKVIDSLSCVIPNAAYEKTTKRSVLSMVQKVYDPLGFLSPALFPAKIMIQCAWSLKIGWDAPLEPDLSKQMTAWLKNINILKTIKIPRQLTFSGPADKELHTFCDASQHGYASVVFMRSVQNENVLVRLIQSKTRVAPLKKMSIPRLELMACCIGARLTKTILEAFDNPLKCIYWTDSSTALAWIKRPNQWGRFVGNRVEEILKISRSEDWRHVPGEYNPADLPSRGCSAVEFVESNWWEGPRWLKKPEMDWPCFCTEVDENEVNKEFMKSASLAVTAAKEDPWYYRRSSHILNIRIVARIVRLFKKSDQSSELSLKELQDAENRVFKLCQSENFKMKKIRGHWKVEGFESLPIILDKSDLVRVNSRLLYTDEPDTFKMPILLPSTHPVVFRYIEMTHNQNCHAGVQFLMSKLRETVWIIGCRRSVKTVVRNCFLCQKWNSKHGIVKTPPLPEDRVTLGRAFQTVGVDLTGPLFLKQNKKVWIVLFTCAVYRAVHLELVSSLSTEDFLLSFIRFVNRRGRPDKIYSDNGTNFRGCDNLFLAIDWTKVKKQSNAKQIEWEFIPPSAPWWGGFWERLIGMVKNLLRRVLGHQKLNYITLETCLTDVEAVINGRPLTYVSENPDDLKPLTPSMFIQDNDNCYFSELSFLNGDQLRNKYKQLLKMKTELKQRFRSEYLALLVDKSKTNKNEPIKLGDIVLVELDNKKRLEWPIGRVVEVKTSRDGLIRSAIVKTMNGELLRPIQKMYRLEVADAAVVSGLVMTPQVDHQVGVSPEVYL